MDRPFPVDAAALAASTAASTPRPATRPLIDLRRGTAILGAAFVAATLGATLGYGFGYALGVLAGPARELASPLAQAFACLLGGSAALTLTLRRLAPAELHDRLRGCAWFGAPDAAISHAFLVGGLIAVLDVLLLMPQPMRQGDWPLAPAMLLAFAAIAVVPVLEELLLRGLLFAMLNAQAAPVIAALSAAAASVPFHALGLVPHPATAFAAIVTGACAMALRWRHASLAPAIAVNCGAAFIRCVLAALG